MKNELNVAVCEMTSIDDVDANLQQIKNIISSVPEKQKVDLFCFPENCLYMRIIEGEKVQSLELTDPVFHEMVSIAKKRQSAIHIGASPIKIEGQTYNASVLIKPDGHVSSTYQKVHLFDIQLTGQKPMRESDVFKHGSKPVILDLDGWKIGQSICYDLRFSELYSYYAKEECDLILIPAAFLPKTGEAHWEVLLRARAIESQAYVVASAQGGVHRNERGERGTHGNSMAIDPWGRILAHIQTRPTAQVVTLSKEKIAEVRRQIPMKSHRRLHFS
jgi:deaminated glutathione amidase